ncbi:uncharacterized protein LOC133916775 isoform X2 [Phragmites australis]|uniref:uncharacterized protein LOC133916775 isoform X2 n=1 Tax=Phragmites australis TaxID=29695 RepID=UPI002D79ED34|nr:uncharacterized protein LOC133916775 isoform X2 [Phragmites australis]
MGVLNWVQSRIHGAHHSKKKAEFIVCPAQHAETSSGIPRTYELNDGWSTGMLSIRTFGTREGHRLKSSDGSCTVSVGELKKLQEEVRSLMRAEGVTTADELNRVHYLTRIIWGLLHKNTHLENSAFSDHVIRDDRAVQMPRQEKAGVDEGGKWIRTDSEYIVLEI